MSHFVVGLAQSISISCQDSPVAVLAYDITAMNGHLQATNDNLTSK